MSRPSSEFFSVLDRPARFCYRSYMATPCPSRRHRDFRMPKLLVVAGEASGDLHGANLLGRLLKMGAHFEAFGIGGDRMRSCGVDLVRHFRDLSVVGFSEAVRRLPSLRGAMRDLFHSMVEKKPDVVLLIDYPGFNLRFARLAKLKGYRIVYYITPQVWAWGGWRIKQLSKFVDRLIPVLPFEKKLYEDFGLNVSFVGHPLLDVVQRRLSREDFCTRLGFDPEVPIIGILPGSRGDEVKRILPTMLLSLQSLGNAQYLLLLSPHIERQNVEKTVAQLLPRVRILNGMTYEAMSSSDLLLVASGTATLEAAILGTPMLIVYRVSPLSWLIAKILVKVPYIGLVNIVAGREVVPEFIQFKATPKRLSRVITQLLEDREKRESIRAELNRVKHLLGERGATERAAEILMEMLE